jgi:hypothetical protein
MRASLSSFLAVGQFWRLLRLHSPQKTSADFAGARAGGHCRWKRAALLSSFRGVTRQIVGGAAPPHYPTRLLARPSKPASAL